MNEVDWTAGLKALDPGAMKSFSGIDFDNEADYRGLTVEDASYVAQRQQVTYLDLRKVKRARDHIQRLPNEGEAIHLLMGGGYQLFHCVPAVLELAAPATIDTLHLCTLSYSKENAADLLALIDARLFDPLAAALKSRGHYVPTCRSHAKIFMFKLTDGRQYVIHSSANARSCKSIEQACFERDDGLFRFHTG